GKQLATASADETVRVWDAASGAEIRTLRGLGAPASQVWWSGDGRRLVGVSAGGNRPNRIRVWDAASGDVLLALVSVNWYDVTQAARVVQLSGDGRTLATAGFDLDPDAGRGDRRFHILVWDLTTGKA